MNARSWMVALGLVGSLASAHAEDQVTVEVTSTGTGAKRVLAYAVPAGTTQAPSLGMTLKSTTQMMGQQVAFELPELTAKLEVSAGAPQAKGTPISVTYSSVAFASRPTGLGAMVGGPLEASLQGAKASLVLAADGRARDLEVKMASAIGQDGAEAVDLERWFVPLPTVPLGQGAVWKAHVVGTAPNGLEITVDTTYTLTDLSETGATLALVLESAAAPGTMDTKGMKAKVTSSTTSGTGTQTLRFDRPMPLSARLELTSKMDLLVQGMATTQTSEIVLTVGE
ncbi:MAG: hypothetical protein KC656_30740 [Myxococcales bacterium]|nr:hypothetical protein [Myxococcales bacterium]